MWLETASGAYTARPVLEQPLTKVLQRGDTLVVVRLDRLDRLGRSLRHLLDVVEQLAAAGVGLQSLHEAMDTTTASGRMVLSVFGALAEFERELFCERTWAGLEIANSRGRRGGRGGRGVEGRPPRSAPGRPGARARRAGPRAVAAVRARDRPAARPVACGPVDDTATWARVARETSGAFAAWSTRVEPVPGPFAATSDALARFGTTRPSRVPKASPSAAVKGASWMLLAAAHGGQSKTAQAVMFRQMVNLTPAQYEAHRAIGPAQAAAQIERAVRGQLATIAAGLPAIDAHGRLVPESDVALARRIASTGQAPATAIGSPVPNTLEPAREAVHTAPTLDQGGAGHER
ncbi:hypothetical protein CCE01nite_30230 [Cellulomonas cellasea]|uniref:Resolvase/invertase-type recombinase catalytic domain-containing protein n=1 Tax=Cellulomonas cellasea TaxID=43670 RepID=A0A4Y3L049_9CELL|nr:hypothetical protein CCE01nite_30230 [Cellulomonas cellasea]